MATDFDFDEIDKAVNGALGGDTSAQAQPDANVTPASSTSTSASSEKPASSASNPASRRSSGRFMDMVHPSSDMKNGAASGVNGAVPNPGVRRPTPAPVASTEAADTTETDAWNQPLESPFLPDAVVEKRPLGGAAPTQHDFDALELLEAPDDPRIEAHTMPDPIDFAEQSAKAKDLAQAEPEAELDVPEIQPEATKESQPVFNPEFNDALSADTSSETFDTVSQEAPVQGPGYGDGSFQPTQDETEPVGPTSIQQQYKEQPSSSPESGAIFDTEAYHKPLAPVAKKKSGILVVLWILLLVAFGGGMGAAVYFFVLPML